MRCLALILTPTWLRLRRLTQAVNGLLSRHLHDIEKALRNALDSRHLAAQAAAPGAAAPGAAAGGRPGQAAPGAQDRMWQVRAVLLTSHGCGVTAVCQRRHAASSLLRLVTCVRTHEQHDPPLTCWHHQNLCPAHT